MRKVYVEYQDPDIETLFREQGDWIATRHIEMADLVCLTGGADITPAIYGEEMDGSVGCDMSDDIHSFGLVSLARALGKPLVGICRGGQVINVANGGTMKQHIEGHCCQHKITTPYGDCGVVCGHHQEMLPSDNAVEIIRNPGDGVAEIVLYGNELCFQPHPEWDLDGDSPRLFFSYLEKVM